MPRCPVCRQQHYHKHAYGLGAQWHREQCAVRIQALLRGWRCRARYAEQRAAWYRAGRGETTQRRRFYAGQLSGVAGRLNDALQARHSEVDRLLMDADSQVAATKAAVWAGIQELERRAAARHQPGAAPVRSTTVIPAGAAAAAAASGGDGSQHLSQAPIDPEFVRVFQGPLRQAEARASAGQGGWHSTDCAVCMAEARWGGDALASVVDARGAAGKAVALLSCSHILHVDCIASWERFQAGDATCPVCRAAYSRCALDSEALRQLQ